MTLHDFKESLSEQQPPMVGVLLQALWYDAKGDWNKAHVLVQDDPTRDGAWIHAYLHRAEGDLGNAHYWYHRAHRKKTNQSLREEWDSIAGELLSR